MNTEVIIIIVVAVLVLLAVVAFFVLKKEKFSTLSNLQYTENIINRLVNQLYTSNLSPTDLTSIFNLTITCINENSVYINIAANSIPGSSDYMSAMQTISDKLYKYSGTSFYPVAQSLFDLYFSIRLYTNVLSQLNTNANYNKVLTYFPEFPSLLYFTTI